MENNEGLIFDVQSYYLHDGQGCRTQIFFSGCPLECDWCSNPEGSELRERILFSPEKCKNRDLHCSRCIDFCSNGAITIEEDGEIPLKVDFKKCKKCTAFDCSKACFYSAFRVAGKWMTKEEIMDLLNRERQYWGAKGGVTFSGGEAFVQHEFLKELLIECKKAGIHTAIETTANVPTDIFMDNMSKIDVVFIDLKHMDPVKHKEKTGVSNELILQNIKMLALSEWSGRVCLRMSLIPDFNDNRENAIHTANFMNAFDLFEIIILPFHPLEKAKWEQVGIVYPYLDYEKTPDEKVNEIQDIFLDRGIACYKDDDMRF